MNTKGLEKEDVLLKLRPIKLQDEKGGLNQPTLFSRMILANLSGMVTLR